MNQFRPAEFEMTDTLINGFRRQIPKPMDCVINALQLMGALSSKCAELMRIVAGDGGFQKDQIEKDQNFIKKNDFRNVWPGLGQELREPGDLPPDTIW